MGERTQHIGESAAFGLGIVFPRACIRQIRQGTAVVWDNIRGATSEHSYHGCCHNPLAIVGQSSHDQISPRDQALVVLLECRFQECLVAVVNLSSIK
jgi:hypothetical protein